MKMRKIEIPDALYRVMVNCLPDDVPNTAKNVGFAVEVLILHLGKLVMRNNEEKARNIGILLVEYYEEERRRKEDNEQQT